MDRVNQRSKGRGGARTVICPKISKPDPAIMAYGGGGKRGARREKDALEKTKNRGQDPDLRKNRPDPR